MTPDPRPPYRKPLLGDTSWMQHAACIDIFPEVFFPKSENHSTEVGMAKTVCRTCPVRDQCLQFAIDNLVIGIWGGTTTEERQQLRHRATRTEPACRNGHPRTKHWNPHRQRCNACQHNAQQRRNQKHAQHTTRRTAR